MKLVTIPFSHFCEKGRWGIDRTDESYKEVKFAPVAQRFAVMPLGSLTVPVLIAGRTVVRESTEILEFADTKLPPEKRLFPEDPGEREEVLQLVKRFDEGIAPDIRRWFYAWVLADRERVMKYAVHGLPRNQRAFLTRGMKVVSTVLTRHFGLKSDTFDRMTTKVSAEFDHVSGLLADGRKYLIGDRFTAADLAWASFTGAFAGAPGYGGSAYTPPPVPDELRAQSEAWSSSLAGQLTQRAYAEHR